MKITVDRTRSTKKATISCVYIDDRFFCFGLEDAYHANKIAGQTRIPAGTYDVRVRQYGPMNARYLKVFGAMHHGMLEIKNVPNFTDILIHCGNSADDTAGCLLVGFRASTSESQDITISKSRDAYEALYKKVIDSARANELTIEIIDNDFKAKTN